MEPTLASLERQLNAVVTKGMQLEAVLAKLLVREAVTASILRQGGQMSQILMSHVVSVVRAYNVETAKPRFVVVNPGTGRERPGVSLDDLVCECRLSRDFSAFFKSPAGGAAKTRRMIANNPWNLGPSFNVAEQARLLVTNKGLAARLIQEAERSLYGIWNLARR